MSLYEEASCKGMPIDLFFEDYEADPKVAKETDTLCGTCPVAKECLKMGVETAGTGVHGGIYLVLGHYSKLKNKHKSPEHIEASKQAVLKAKGELID